MYPPCAAYGTESPFHKVVMAADCRLVHLVGGGRDAAGKAKLLSSIEEWSKTAGEWDL